MSRRVVALPNPGASLFVLPNPIRARVITLYCDITTDAVVGNRSYVLRITDKTGVVKLQCPVGQTIAASTSRSVNAHATAFTSVGSTLACQLPQDLILEEGDTVIGIDTAVISIGDRITNIVAVIEVEPE